jgi:hypothetical protein
VKKNEINQFRKVMWGLLGILVVLVFGGTHVYATEQKHVLFISSYSESFPTVPEQIKGMQEVFRDKNIKLELEYMDTKRFSTDENIANFYQSLNYKLKSGTEFDAIIVGDDAALQFARRHQEDLFSALPIIFLGVNDKERARVAASNPYMTGITEGTNLEANIRLAMQFQPKATKLVAIVDNTLTGKGDQKQFEQVCKEFNNLKSQV